jgi:hypothetical protein
MTKDVKSCIFTSSNLNITNITTHLTSQHRSEQLYLKEKGKEDEVKKKMLEEESKEKKKFASALGAKVDIPKTVIEIEQMCASFLYRFFNSANIAIRQANNQNLNKLIKCLIENGHVLKSKSIEITFSRYKYKKQEYTHFNNFICYVQQLINSARIYYVQELNEEVPFLSVSHDGWDSKDHDILGVSIHFVIPKDFVRVNLAVGLKRVDSKKSDNTVQEINNILQR